MATDEPHEVADINSRLDEIARQIGVIQRATTAGEPASAPQPPPAAAPAPLSLQAAIAEIAARQSELDRSTPQPAAAARTREPDFSSLHQQLVHIINQIETLRPGQDIEELIAHFRAELADIRQAVTEAVPAHAIETLQQDIRDLARRIDERRDNGGDATTLGGIEYTLTEIRAALLKLTPAEQLAGFDEAIHGLNRRLDSIMRRSDDPTSVHQLEDAITALRSVVANIASTETLQRLSADVQALGARIDDMTQPAAGVGLAGSEAFSHLEQRIVTLLERLEATNARSADLSRVEASLTEVLTRLEQQRTSIAALQHDTARFGLTGEGSATTDPALMETIKRELSDIRYSQSESDRQTQDALETVHTTLGHIVDRLALIEDDLRQAPPPGGVAPQTLPPRPELPNPVVADIAPSPLPPGGDAPSHAGAPEHGSDSTASHNHAGNHFGRGERAMLVATPLARAPINPALPPDHPLEPGSRLPARDPAARSNSPAEGMADTATPAGTVDFIAAARRAAQAAAAIPAESQTHRLAMFAEVARKALRRGDAKPNKPDADKPDAAPDAAMPLSADKPGRLGTRIRALLVGTGIVVVALGGFKIATLMIDGGGSDIELTAPISLEDLEQAPEPTAAAIAPVLSQPAAPSLTSPTPLDRQTRSTGNAAPQPDGNHDTTPTGTITAPAARISIPATETLPASLGSPGLRAAALNGNPAAAYQVALHYADGNGVAASHSDALKWYQRAADGGVVPAMFRLGTFYEKGLGVKKDLDAARIQYQRAAEHGNAKAMHNLAVLYADGGGNGADYHSAAEWFRKAAVRGVADSQYNLAILCARGIGVTQNLAESYKWFSLAAAQGDADAGHKRDEIANRLDAQSLAAAKLAVQTFVTERQPADAVNVPTPVGGWDAASATTPRSTKTATAQRAAR